MAALWLFGLFTTILLAGVWGRAVTTDEGALRAGADAVLESDVVASRVVSWLEDALADAAGSRMSRDAVVGSATAIWRSAETKQALTTLIDRFVDAAMDPDGGKVVVDLGDSLRPMVPVVTAEMSSRGLPMDESVVSGLLDGLPAIVLATDSGGGIGQAIATARAILTKVLVVGLAGIAIAAIVAVALAEDRLRQMGGLAGRLAASALSFAVLLRVGSWALDPSGGRSPLAAGGSALLSAGGRALFLTALVSAIVAVVAVALRRRRRLTPA